MTVTGLGAKAATPPPPIDSDRARMARVLARAAEVSLSGDLADEALTEEVLDGSLGSWLFNIGIDLGVAIPRAVVGHIRAQQGAAEGSCQNTDGRNVFDRGRV